MTITEQHPRPTAGTRPARPDRSQAGVTARLRAVLAANATMSVSTGMAMAVVPDVVDELLATGHPGWVRLVGIGLVLFGLDVALLSRSSVARLRRFTPWIVAADVAWVAASALVLLLGWFAGGGVVAVIAVAIAVDGFATLQFLTWRRLPRVD